ncbi:MAG: DNA-directed RNA polymerase subunit omega [Clostridiales bacterium]|jgi:DNA-directed RNA polymerase subunit omega|nr:DNA-directed RNA polymerase subunit omega [Clostridiales bacterium]
MLKPSYSELMQVLNNDPDLDSKITSRYAVVIAASKRARQLIDGAEPRAEAETNKAVSIAVMEMNDGLIKIFPEGTEEDAPIEADASMQAYFDAEADAVTTPESTVTTEKAEDFAGVYDQFDDFDDDDAFEDDDLDLGADDLEDDAFDEE